MSQELIQIPVICMMYHEGFHHYRLYYDLTSALELLCLSQAPSITPIVQNDFFDFSSNCLHGSPPSPYVPGPGNSTLPYTCTYGLLLMCAGIITYFILRLYSDTSRLTYTTITRWSFIVYFDKILKVVATWT